MPNRASATIRIGGVIPLSFVPTLLRAIACDDRAADCDGGEVSANDIVSGVVLEIYGDQVVGGKFENVEALCRQHGLAYVRKSDACRYAFEAERVVYTGEGSPRVFEVNDAEYVVLTKHDLNGLGSIEAANAWFESSEFTPPVLTIMDATGD